MQHKRKLFFILSITLIITLLFPIFVSATEIKVGSEAAIIAEQNTGKIIYEKNARVKMYPASTTKVMTALLTLEKCNLDDIAIVNNTALQSVPSGYAVANLQLGEKLSVKDLLYALLVKSANEAANVLAEHIGGSVKGFADMMNARAKELGCENTHFVNPNGVHNKDHYSTAYDLFLIAKEAMKNETFRTMVATTSYTLPTTNKYPNADRSFPTTNDLIRVNKNNRADNYYYKYATGIKTGYTKEAKNCLIAGSNRDGLEFISVILGAGITDEGLSVRYLDTINLFNYAYENYTLTKIKEHDTIIDTVVIENGTKETKNLDLRIQDDVTVVNPKNIDAEEIIPDIKLNENLRAPIVLGETVGTITYSVDGISYTSNLLAGNTVYEKTDISIYILVAGLGILLFAIVLMPKKRKKSKKRKRIRKN